MFPTLSGIGDQTALRGLTGHLYTAAINISGAGYNPIVAAVAAAAGVPAKIIRVLAYVVVPSGIVSVSWESSGGTVLAGPMTFAGGAVATAPYSPLGHFSSLSGEGLGLYLDMAVQVGGHVTYVIVQ